jgi:hypothetical protein
MQCLKLDGHGTSSQLNAHVRRGETKQWRSATVKTMNRKNKLYSSTTLRHGGQRDMQLGKLV